MRKVIKVISDCYAYIFSLKFFLKFRFIFGLYSDITNSTKWNWFLKFYCATYVLSTSIAYFILRPDGLIITFWAITATLEYFFGIWLTIFWGEKNFSKFYLTLNTIDILIEFNRYKNNKNVTAILYTVIYTVKFLSEIFFFDGQELFSILRLIITLVMLTNYMRYVLTTYKFELFWKRFKFLTLTLKKYSKKEYNNNVKQQRFQKFLRHYKHLINIMEETNSEIMLTVIFLLYYRTFLLYKCKLQNLTKKCRYILQISSGVFFLTIKLIYLLATSIIRFIYQVSVI